MHVLAASDKFRGTATAPEVNRAIAAGARSAGWTCRTLPLADGGEGTLDAFGGANRTTRVTGPLWEPVDAGWRLDGEFAVIEMARASGLLLAGGKEGNDALRATTRGTGELIAVAIAAGATHVVVGVGGSATTDGGVGAVEALSAWTPFNDHGVKVEVACDVRTTFVEAPKHFASQKGASANDVAALTDRLESLRAAYRDDFGVDVEQFAGSGAAGGLAGGLAAIGARLTPGFDLIADALGLDDALAGTDAVVTGEGLLDATSFDGKVVGGLLRRTSARGIRTVAIVGNAAFRPSGELEVVSLVERFGIARAWADTEDCIAEATASLLRACDGASPNSAGSP